MSDSQLKQWSDNPNALKIPYSQYFEEKVYFAGVLLSSILYGTGRARPRRSIPTLFGYSRNSYPAVLPMHRRAA